MEAAQAVGGFSARLRARGHERELERLRPLGEAYVMRRFGGSLNRADAEDAVAEVVIRLHRRIAQGRVPDNLRAAFFTSCRNAAIDQMRFRGSRPTVALEAAADMAAAAPPPLEWAEGREDGQRLREALGRMRPNYREAILLRFGLGLTVPEIAARLGISLPAAKKLVLRSTAQVRKRLAAIEGQEFCPEMQDLARRSLLEKEAAGLASEAEAEVLHAHFAHCGSCRSFLSSLHEHLQSLGGAAVLGGWASARSGVLHHLTAFADRAVHVGHLGVEKARLLAFRAGGAMQSDGAGPASALGTTSQKVAAVCTVGAAGAATCLAAGVVGPGIGLGVPTAVHHHRQRHPVEARKVLQSEAPSAPVEAVASPPVEAAEPSPSPEPKPTASASSRSHARHKPAPKPEPEPAPETPAEQTGSEFGIESSPPPEATSAPPPSESSSATSSSSSSVGSSSSSGSSGSGGGSSSSSSGGGSESFGFHG